LAFGQKTLKKGYSLEKKMGGQSKRGSKGASKITEQGAKKQRPLKKVSRAIKVTLKPGLTATFPKFKRPIMEWLRR